MDIVLGTADRDICKGFNEHLSEILSRKGIHHLLDVKHNAEHDWPLWRHMFPEYVSRI
jgi:esterase/lipase superfamily enzyme